MSLTKQIELSSYFGAVNVAEANVKIYATLWFCGDAEDAVQS